MDLSDSRSQTARLLLSPGSLNSHNRNRHINIVSSPLSMIKRMNQSDGTVVNSCDDDEDGSDGWYKDSGGAKHSDSFQIQNNANNVYDNYCSNNNAGADQIVTDDDVSGGGVRDSDEPISNSLYDRLSMFVERSSKTIPRTTSITHKQCCSKLICWKYLVFVFYTIAWFSSFGTCLAARQEGE